MTEFSWKEIAEQRAGEIEDLRRQIDEAAERTPQEKAAGEMYKELELIKNWYLRNAEKILDPVSVTNMIENAEEIEAILKKARGAE